MEKEEFFKKGHVVALGAVICCMLWGSAFPFIKLGYASFQIASSDTATQILFAGMRFFLAGILAFLLGSALEKKVLFPKKSSWAMVFKQSLAQTVFQYLFFYIGLAHISGVRASIITATNVFVAIIISSLIFRMEKVGARKIIGCIIGFSGVVVMNADSTGLAGAMKWNGEGLLFLSTVSYGLSTVLSRRYSQKEHPVTLSSYQFMLGGAILMILGLALGGKITNWTGKGAAILIYLAFLSAVAYSLWGILLKHNPVSRVTIYGFANPVFGVILSAILLKEENQAFTLKGLMALLLVSIGIVIVNGGKTGTE